MIDLNLQKLCKCVKIKIVTSGFVCTSPRGISWKKGSYEKLDDDSWRHIIRMVLFWGDSATKRGVHRRSRNLILDCGIDPNVGGNNNPHR